jgi:hypothetical protein
MAPSAGATQPQWKAWKRNLTRNPFYKLIGIASIAASLRNTELFTWSNTLLPSDQPGTMCFVFTCGEHGIESSMDQAVATFVELS